MIILIFIFVFYCIYNTSISTYNKILSYNKIIKINTLKINTFSLLISYIYLN